MSADNNLLLFYVVINEIVFSKLLISIALYTNLNGITFI